MKFVASASEPEMVLAFLEAELNSPVWGRRIRELIGDTSLITSGDPTDGGQNELRKTVLAETRGYGRNMWLFEGFPADVDWVRLDASIGDLGAMRHMDYPHFGNSRVGRSSSVMGPPTLTASKRATTSTRGFGRRQRQSRRDCGRLRSSRWQPPQVTRSA
jgi:hypothetical protein